MCYGLGVIILYHFCMALSISIGVTLTLEKSVSAGPEYVHFEYLHVLEVLLIGMH